MRSRHITRRKLFVILLAALLIVAGAVGVTAYAGSASSGDESPIQIAPQSGQVPVIAGTQSQVISTLESRLPLVSKATVVNETVPPAPGSGSAAAAVSGLEVLCDLSVASDQSPDITKALWENDLFEGALRDEFAARGFAGIIDGNATLVTPDGARQPIGGGVSLGVVTDQVFDAIPSDISSTIANSATSLGLTSVKVESMPVLQDVLVIGAVSDSPASDVAAFQQKGGLDFLLGQRASDFEGVYFEIDNSAGNPVYIVDTAPRDGGGAFWADPSLGFGGPHA